MGPLAIFDKSFLQSLNANEAALFDTLFRTNITPLFYIETLADLHKKSTRRTPEVEVGIIASKTPTWGSCVNASHITMCAGELMGHRVEMKQIPALAGGHPVKVEGKKGVYYKPSREQVAFARWQDGKFSDVERAMAREWREIVLKAPKAEPIKSEIRFRDLTEVRSFTRETIAHPNSKWMVFNLGIETATFSQKEMWQAIRIWLAQGLPPIAAHAPYLNHVAQIDLFFAAAVAAGHISPDRASNKIDAAYLYYLPFTQIFISGDNLHQRMVPHFLQEGQKFVWGADLKQDLKRLVEVFKLHPDIDHLGLAKIANTPPKDDTGLIAQLYDDCFPRWRTRQIEVPADAINNNPELHAKIMHEIKTMEAAAKKPALRSLRARDYDNDSLDMLTIERRVAKRRGDWQFLPANLKDD